jgi:hypothetical protein
MFDRNTVRQCFEKILSIPADVYWDEIEEAYLPIAGQENNEYVIRMSHDVNNRFEAYYIAKKEDHKLLKKALELIEQADYFGTSEDKFVRWQTKAVAFREKCLNVLEGEKHEM